MYLQEEIRTEHNFVEIIGNSQALLPVLHQVEQIAPSDATVLILGETGTGKELIARALHDRSHRRGGAGQGELQRDFGRLVESELFGHVKAHLPAPSHGGLGASSWPTAARSSWTRSANCRSTSGQATAGAAGAGVRAGREQADLRVDVRIITATNRDLEDAMPGPFPRISSTG